MLLEQAQCAVVMLHVQVLRRPCCYHHHRHVSDVQASVSVTESWSATLNVSGSGGSVGASDAGHRRRHADHDAAPPGPSPCVYVLCISKPIYSRASIQGYDRMQVQASIPQQRPTTQQGSHLSRSSCLEERCLLLRSLSRPRSLSWSCSHPHGCVSEMRCACMRCRQAKRDGRLHKLNP